MKIVVLIVRLLLGLVFFVFGLNAFLQFLKGPIPGGLAGQFLQALFQPHWSWQATDVHFAFGGGRQGPEPEFYGPGLHGSDVPMSPARQNL